jgi:hypothetical protein
MGLSDFPGVPDDRQRPQYPRKRRPRPPAGISATGQEPSRPLSGGREIAVRFNHEVPAGRADVQRQPRCPWRVIVPNIDERLSNCNFSHGQRRTSRSLFESLSAVRHSAHSVFYIEKGQVKVTVVSHQGKEAVLAIFNKGDFFGEGCLTGQTLRMATASAIGECKIVRVLEKAPVVRLLHDEPEFSETFMLFLLQRNIRVEEDLVDHLFKMRKRRWPLKQSPPITAPRNRCKVVSASFIAC